MTNKNVYVGFYPSRPIWVDQALDFEDPLSTQNFTRNMSEIVFSKSNDNLTLAVCRDGCFMLSIDSLENSIRTEPHTSIQSTMSYWSSYLDHLNSFYLLLDSSMLEIEDFSWFDLGELTNKDAFRISVFPGGYNGGTLATQSYTNQFQLGRYISSYRPDMPIDSDIRISARKTVSRATIEHAVDAFYDAIKNEGCEKHLASFSRSLSEYKVGNFSTSIVLAWFVIESIANRLWSKHLKQINRDIDGKKFRINSDRRKNLTGQLFTANITIQVLELMEIIDFPLFENLDQCRGYRNKVAHTENYSPTLEEAGQALMAAKEMIALGWNVTFTPNLSLSLTM